MSEGTSGMSARAAAGVSRVMSKLKASLESGQYYEAHQMYRTLYFRYSSQKKYSELEELLFEGANKFFALTQIESGIDLSKLYLEVLAKSEKPIQDESLQRISRLYMAFPLSNPYRDQFKADAVQWSIQSGQYPKGHPRLHQLLAYALWTAKRYPESRHHFLHSEDGSGCGHMLVDFHVSNGFPRELELFVAGTVLQYISLRKHIAAAYALKAFTESHPAIGRGPPFKHPLLNFVWLLLLAIEHRHSLAAFSILVEKYKPALLRDPSYLEYLDKIGQNFFGLAPPARPRPGGMFSGIFDSLLNVLGEEETGSGNLGAAHSSRVTSSRRMETEDVE